jgi:hypothetical protein
MLGSWLLWLLDAEDPQRSDIFPVESLLKKISTQTVCIAIMTIPTEVALKEEPRPRAWSASEFTEVGI